MPISEQCELDREGQKSSGADPVVEVVVVAAVEHLGGGGGGGVVAAVGHGEEAGTDAVELGRLGLVEHRGRVLAPASQRRRPPDVDHDAAAQVRELAVVHRQATAAQPTHRRVPAARSHGTPGVNNLPRVNRLVRLARRRLADAPAGVRRPRDGRHSRLVLKNWNSTQPSHRISCWCEQRAWGELVCQVPFAPSPVN